MNSPLSDKLHQAVAEICGFKDWGDATDYRTTGEQDRQRDRTLAIVERLITASTDETKALREALEAARVVIEGHVDDLDELICCNGFECGCLAATNRDLLLHNIDAALKNTRQD